MSRERVVVICPGRGTYNAAELGYFARHHGQRTAFLAKLDAMRADAGQKTISALDGADRYSLAQHTSSENASLLIFACAIADFLAIDQDRYDVVAVTGNSMGWYLALTCGGALSLENGAHLVNTMGTLMQAEGQGGQIVYPVVDEHWRIDPPKEDLVAGVLAGARAAGVEVHISIHLGGLVIFAADAPGLAFLKERLPTEDRYPMELANHAAFHSRLLDHVPPLAQTTLREDLFQKPQKHLIDGRGTNWTPFSTDLTSLYQYTLGHQINRTYDFTRAVVTSVKEHNPDRLILLGPGATLGGAVAQALISEKWQGLTDKAAFKARQAEAPFLLSMGLEEQRRLVTG